MPPPERQLEVDPALREALLEAHPMPKAARYARVRALLYAGLLPLLMMAELDRELAKQGREGAPAALAIDLFLTLAVATDLVHSTPRHPRATALAFGATAARFALLISRTCLKGVHPLFHLGALGAFGAAVATLVLSPTPAEITSHLRRALRLDEGASPPQRGYGPHAAYALFVAAAFPFWLYLVRTSGLSLAPQAAMFLGFALLFPRLGALVFERRGDLAPPRRHPPRRIVGAVTGALVLAFSLVRGSQHLLDAYAHVERCVHPEAASVVRQFIAAERVETNPARRHASTLAFVLATAVLAPVAEELVYRRFLQRVLRRRLGAPSAIAISATVFGLAHMFVYVFTVWQTVLLGVAFGVAFDTGGFFAALATHIVWNLCPSF